MHSVTKRLTFAEASNFREFSRIVATINLFTIKARLYNIAISYINLRIRATNLQNLLFDNISAVLLSSPFFLKLMPITEWLTGRITYILIELGECGYVFFLYKEMKGWPKVLSTSYYLFVFLRTGESRRKWNQMPLKSEIKNNSRNRRQTIPCFQHVCHFEFIYSQ